MGDLPPISEYTRLASGYAKPRKPPPPRSSYPWQAVILAVDTAERSGWSECVCGNWSCAGASKAADFEGDAWRQLVRAVQLNATRMVVPAVLVLEAPFSEKWGGFKRQGTWLGAWRMLWSELAESMPRGIVRKPVLVEPNDWREASLPGYARGMNRNEIRHLERVSASAIVGQEITDHDEAAAICIGQWAIHAGEVGARLTKRQKERQP